MSTLPWMAKGKGAPGYGDGPNGDALIAISIKPHRYFRRQKSNIEIDVPITFDEAVLGASVKVPTIDGSVSLTIPKGASSGQKLRLKGKGIRQGQVAGDQIVVLKIVLPLEKS